MTRINADEAEHDFAGLVRRVSRDKERVVIEDAGRDVVAVVSVDDLVLLERLEDRLDLLDALEAEADAEAKGETPIPWAEAKKRLGL
jgi:prevent-host-death family protein